MRLLPDANIKKGTRVILRADFDVPLKNGKVTDDFRIRRALPAIRHILKKGGSLRIISHLGRPGGKKKREFSLFPVARHLERILKRRVVFVSDWTDRIDKTYPEIMLFENLRFYPGEEKNDPAFARRLAKLGDIYVNEAFANSHRAHASMAALPKLLPSYAGLNLEKELAALEKIMSRPERPFVVIIGGAKLDTKMPVLAELSRKVDKVLIGGVLVRELAFANNGVKSPDKEKLVFPESVALARDHARPVRASSNRARVEVLLKDVKNGGPIADIGSGGILQFQKILRGAKTVVWNGPLGIVENPDFREGTKEIARSISGADTFAVVGGGDTVAALRSLKLLGRFRHVSTGGGAMLEFLAGKKLPGIEALKW